MAAIHDALFAVLTADHPMTVRQVVYQVLSRGAICKSEAEYKGTICRLPTEMRLAGDLPFGWIADNTRWQSGGDRFFACGPARCQPQGASVAYLTERGARQTRC